MVNAQVGRGGLEFLLTLLALAWLAWFGRGLGGSAWLEASDGRFRHDSELRLVALAEAGRTDGLKAFCQRFDDWMPPESAKICAEFRDTDWLARLLGRDANPSRAAKPVDVDTRAALGSFIVTLQAAHEAWAQSFYRQLESVGREREEWRIRAQEGFIDEDGQAELDHLAEKTQFYRESYRLNVRRHVAYSRPVECAWAYLSRRVGPSDNPAAVLAAAGLAALLDGRRESLPDGAFPPGSGWDASEKADFCADSVEINGQTSPLEAALSAASILRLAHNSAGNAAKAEATVEMLPKLWFCLMVWSLNGLFILQLGRRVRQPVRMLAVALLLWALAYALTRPYLEWLGGIGNWLGCWKPAFWLGGSGLSLLLLKPAETPALATTVLPASRSAYPGFVLFVGLGWMLLADLSTYAEPDNRFQALYQQTYVWFAFMLISVLPVLSMPLARFGLRLWSLLALGSAGRWFRAIIGWCIGGTFATMLLMLVALFLTRHRQFTSEIFRFFLLSGLAWFLLARAQTLSSSALSFKLNRAGWQGKALSLRLTLWGLRVKLALPMLLLLGFVVAGLFITKDKGPLLVIVYAGAVFVGIPIARFFATKVGERWGLGLGMLTILPYVWAVSYALFNYGGRFGEYIAERLESAQTPFLSSNDQIAHILWFQELAMDNGGFALGQAPWCGELSGACHGVPPQIQSDYIFTALVGLFGQYSWLVVGLFVIWLWRLARAHPSVTSGEVEKDGLDQAWISWMALCWVGLSLTQMAVTVAGNLAWLPLTGITFPFLSYGAWSLLGNTLFLGFSLHLQRRQ